MINMHSIVALIIIFFVILIYGSIIIGYYNVNNLKLKNNMAIIPYIIVYIIVILSIGIFIFLFIWYNEKAINNYKDALNEINQMHFNQYGNTNINNIISNHNEINKRILFLEERISHYQNNSNNFASLWLTLLSVLFITVTGFNLYNFNESRKRLDKAIDDCEETTKKAGALINDFKNTSEKTKSVLNETSKKDLENDKKIISNNTVGHIARETNNVS